MTYPFQTYKGQFFLAPIPHSSARWELTGHGIYVNFGQHPYMGYLKAPHITRVELGDGDFELVGDCWKNEILYQVLDQHECGLWRHYGLDRNTHDIWVYPSPYLSLVSLLNTIDWGRRIPGERCLILRRPTKT